MADYQVLVVLSETRDDVMPYHELAYSTGWEKSRLSHHVTRMEKRELVRREGREGDGRTANIVLTPQGRAAIESAAPGHVGSVRRLLVDLLTSEEIDTLIAVGVRVNHALEAELVSDSAERPPVGV